MKDVFHAPFLIAPQFAAQPFEKDFLVPDLLRQVLRQPVDSIGRAQHTRNDLLQHVEKPDTVLPEISPGKGPVKTRSFLRQPDDPPGLRPVSAAQKAGKICEGFLRLLLFRPAGEKPLQPVGRRGKRRDCGRNPCLLFPHRIPWPHFLRPRRIPALLQSCRPFRQGQKPPEPGYRNDKRSRFRRLPVFADPDLCPLPGLRDHFINDPADQICRLLADPVDGGKLLDCRPGEIRDCRIAAVPQCLYLEPPLPAVDLFNRNPPQDFHHSGRDHSIRRVLHPGRGILPLPPHLPERCNDFLMRVDQMLCISRRKRTWHNDVIPLKTTGGVRRRKKNTVPLNRQLSEVCFIL